MLLNRKLILNFLLVALLGAMSCKKGTFDINGVNPNTPSSVPPKFLLSGALKSTADYFQGGNQAFANYYVAYWTPSGEYIPDANLLQYHVTTDFASGNFDNAYIILANYKIIENSSAGIKNQNYYSAISKIMQTFHYQLLVDYYGDVPYLDATKLALNTLPKYDKAQTVYEKIYDQLDTAINLIKNAPADVESPGSYDVMFGGNMSKWTKFANTLKLRLLIRQTEISGRLGSYIQPKAAAISGAFLGTGEDAAINPGYSSSSNANLNPLWAYIGTDANGVQTGSSKYNRATTYAVNFYKNTNDPRLARIYQANKNGLYAGRMYGSVSGTEKNDSISDVGGPGILKSPSQAAIILPASESLFLQAEAAFRGIIPGDYKALYKAAVAQSFNQLGLSSASAATYYSQTGDKVNIDASSNPLFTIIIQEWAALNSIDPYEAYSNYRRLHIPADIPLSIYPGTTAANLPRRLNYTTSEYSYNTANVNAEGTIDPIANKVFWMP